MFRTPYKQCELVYTISEIFNRNSLSWFQDINPEALCYGILALVALCYGILALLNDESCYILSSYISSVFIKWRVANINLAAGNVFTSTKESYNYILITLFTIYFYSLLKIREHFNQWLYRQFMNLICIFGHLSQNMV